MSDGINWDVIMRPFDFSDHCTHHADLNAARDMVREREREIANLQAELRARHGLIAAVVRRSGGRLTVRYDDFGAAVDDLDVFGWRGEYVVVQDHPYEQSDAQQLPGSSDD